MAFAEVLATATLVRKLAQVLKDKGLVANSDGIPPRTTDLALGIGQMVEDGLFQFDGLDLDGELVPEDLIIKFSQAVKEFQEKFPDKLNSTGKIDQSLLNLLKRPTCSERPPRDIPKIGPDASPAHPFGTGRPKLRVLVESLPPVTNRNEAVERAWDIWAKHINLDITETANKSEANIILNVANLDGTGRTVGDADSGPPGDRLMEVRFDSNEDWTEAKFLYTCIHEFGHILGLRHSATPNAIMFKSVQPDFFDIQKNNKNVISDEDIRRIQSVWGPRKK